MTINIELKTTYARPRPLCLFFVHKNRRGKESSHVHSGLKGTHAH